MQPRSSCLRGEAIRRVEDEELVRPARTCTAPVIGVLTFAVESPRVVRAVSHQLLGVVLGGAAFHMQLEEDQVVAATTLDRVAACRGGGRGGCTKHEHHQRRRNDPSQRLESPNHAPDRIRTSRRWQAASQRPSWPHTAPPRDVQEFPPPPDQPSRRREGSPPGGCTGRSVGSNGQRRPLRRRSLTSPGDRPIVQIPRRYVKSA